MQNKAHAPPRRSIGSLRRLIADADSPAERDELVEQLKATQQHDWDAGEARAERMADERA